MENFNEKKYIDTLIDTFNKYNYHTDNHTITALLSNLNQVENNKELLLSLNNLNSYNLAFPFLHQEKYVKHVS